MNKSQKRIEDYIRSKIDESELPGWKCPWIARAKCNFITGRAYTGGNAALVAFDENEYFMTFKQAKEIGYIKKGTHGLPIPFYKMMQDRENPDKVRPILVSYYTVFGLEDIEITDQEAYNKIMGKRQHSFNTKSLPEIEEFLTSIGVDVKSDPARAYHTHGKNTIHIPKINQFDKAEEYYRTVFHELGHWTGESWICKRDKTGNKFGNAGYAKEELVAEIYSNYLAADYGFNLSEQSAVYIKGWLQAIKDKPFTLMKAFSDAQTAYTWTVQKLLKEGQKAA